MHFSDWDDTIHDLPEQRSRIARALESKVTILELDEDSQSAIFKGSSSNYVTMLNYCTCADYARRHYPCKHIYRLAIELGLCPEISKEEYVQFMSYDEALALLSNVPLEALKILKEALYLSLYQKEDTFAFENSENLLQLISMNFLQPVDDLSVCLERAVKYNRLRSSLRPLDKNEEYHGNMSKKDMVAWTVKYHPQIAVNLSSDYTAVSIHTKISKMHTKLYQYVHKIVDPDPPDWYQW